MRQRRGVAGVAAVERRTGACEGGGFARGRRTVSETDAWARGRIKRKTERAGPPTLSTGRSDGSKKKHRSNHRSKVDRI